VSIRTPKTLAAATSLLERHAELEGQIASIEARRTRMLVRANAAADAKVGPLVDELDQIFAAVEPWWRASGKDLAKDRKSIQLGGCMIGTRSGKPKLAHTFDDDDKAVTALRATPYKNQTTRVKYALDRAATLKLLQLDGKTGKAIAALGFSIDQADTFSIQRVEQSGSIGA
jgi:hypothetical protein